MKQNLLSLSQSKFLVGQEQHSARLDRFLVSVLPSLSRTRIQALIRQGNVRADGIVFDDPSSKVTFGQVLEIVLPAPVAAEPKPQQIPLSILYEDDHLLVVDKPAGLVMHPAAGHAEGTLVNALIAHCGDSLSGIGGVKRPGIIHRLDKDTSGVLVVAKTDEAHIGLCEQFAVHGRDGRLTRAYVAFIWGVLHRSKGTVDLPLSRSDKNRKKISVIKNEAKGRHAVTHYEVLQTFLDKKGNPALSCIRLILETGRTHQIRVHMAHLGHPLLGDSLYGKAFFSKAACLEERARFALDRLGRQALHAEELGFEHPITKKGMYFHSNLPTDLLRLKKALTSKG